MNKPDLNAIKALADGRASAQKSRIMAGNRIFAIYGGKDNDSVIRLDSDEKGPMSPARVLELTGSEILAEVFRAHEEIERMYERALVKELDNVEIVQRMKQIKGCGDVLAAKIYSLINIDLVDKYPSALIKWAGYANDSEGQPMKMRKGEKISWNPELKKTIYQLGDCFIKCRSPYRKLYDQRKQFEKDRKPDIKDGHADMRAIIRMEPTSKMQAIGRISPMQQMRKQ